MSIKTHKHPRRNLNMTLIESQMNIKQMKFDTLNSIFWERKTVEDIVNGFLLCQVPYVSKKGE